MIFTVTRHTLKDINVAITDLKARGFEMISEIVKVGNSLHHDSTSTSYKVKMKGSRK